MMASALDALEQALRDQPRKPPIEKWHPPLSGTIDIRIDARGDWFHEGTQIQRKPLINLFASILRRESDGEYYLVTPVEKWRIRVDDTPLLAVDMEIAHPGEQQKLIFRLNTDELVALDDARVLHIDNIETEPYPWLELERGLAARLTSSLFYRLIDTATQRGDEIGICSCGKWIVLAKTLSGS